MKPFGLYIHIPFCSKICHYCDFAKTSNYSSEHVEHYFSVIYKQLDSWLQTLDHSQKFSSVFFGGGTPGLFTKEYEPFFKLLENRLSKDCEITLEANPHNIQKANLQTWRDLGINRVSIGVQSFDSLGLTALTRDHSSLDAVHAVELAASVIKNINLDLIYGWKDQNEDSWLKDLEIAANLPIKHLSLYNLTFEGSTPMARSVRRGVTHPKPDEFLEWCYNFAVDYLAVKNFEHEEISNWSKSGFSSKHNWLYWQGMHYIGIGCGAHGYIEDNTSFGYRYSYTSDLRKYLRECEGDASYKASLTEEDDRNEEIWLMEYVGCALRCRDGIDLNRLSNRGWIFTPNKNVSRATQDGLIFIDKNKLTLTEKEWFRETSWSLAVIDSFLKK